MHRYYILLAALTVILIAILSLLKGEGVPLWLPFWFAALTGIQHFFVVRSLYRSARRFVQIFLAVTVASLFLHLTILAAWLLTHTSQVRNFTIAFAIGFALYLVFETIALVITVNKEKKKRQ